MNEQPKTVEEEANRFADNYANSFKNEPDEINSIMFQACKAGYVAATSDPANIADIVRQTLEYAQESMRYGTPKFAITKLHPEIVNNIIKNK